MEIREAKIPGVIELIPRAYADARGSFFEVYREEHLQLKGVNFVTKQINQSHSHQNVLRGLHCQYPNPQAKLVRVLQGAVLDVCVDLRAGSKTFGKWLSVRLSDEARNQLFIPQGFAHGFVTLSDQVIVEYLCDDYYHPTTEFTILWNDPTLNIQWPISNPLVSDKDNRGLTFKEFVDKYGALKI